jgi:predicted NUDIX family NTP pyrophosphohydrolase
MAKGKHSAGILMFRSKQGSPELLLVHPGGPFWAKKDTGAWSIPKGLFDDTENALDAAKREFEEETGCRPEGQFLELGNFKQPSGKTISAWAIEGEFDLKSFRSNFFPMEWPPKSGKIEQFPEADRAAWFGPSEAVLKITKGQVGIVEILLSKIGFTASPTDSNRFKHDERGQGSLF